MMRKLTSILILCAVTAFGAENVAVDTKNRNVINTGVVNFAPNQLQVNGVAITPGGGGGGGGGATSITLSFPGIYASPLSFNNDGAGNWTASAAYANAPATSFFGNGTGSPAAPTFMDLPTTRVALGINNLDNTSDANKPISTAQAAVNSTFTTGIASNRTDITAINATLSGLRLDTIAAPTANVSLAGFNLTNVATPVNPNDGANKAYVDTAANVGPPHPVVAVASTANLTLSGEQTIDGVTTSASRILVKNQSTASQNGIYVTAAGAWSRASDANTGTSVSGVVFVQGGTTQSATSWGVTTPQPITLGTTSIAYTLTGTGGTTYTNGTGLALSGNQFSLAPIATGNVLGNKSGGSAAPTAQATTTTGFNLLAVSDGSTVRYPQINADNTISTFSASGFRGQIGAGTVTSFATTQNNSTDLLTLSVANSGTTPNLTIDKTSVTGASVYGTSATGVPTFMSASTARGALGGTTVGQNLFTLANPGGSGITFPRFNNDNTISALAPNAFLGSVGASPVDSAVLFGNTGGTSVSPFTWTAGATSGLQNVGMTTGHYVLLPPAIGYAPGKRIIYTDTVTNLTTCPTGDCGMTFRRSSTDTLNGGTGDFLPFVVGGNGPYGGKSVEFENVAGTGWQVVTTAGNAFKVESTSNANKSFFFSADNQASGSPGTLTAGPGQTVSVVPQNPLKIGNSSTFVTGLDGPSGQLFTSAVYQRDVLSNQADITQSSGTYTVTDTGDIDNIRLSGSLTAPLTIVLPQTINYQVAQPVFFYDASGSITGSNTVTIIPSGADTINGIGSAVLNQAFDSRRLVANSTNHNWTIEGSGGGVVTDIWHTVSPVSNIATINCLSNVDTNLTIIPISADTTIAFNNVGNGSKGLIKIRDVTGNHTITVPNAFKTPDRTPKGTFVTTTGSNVEDEWRWDYDGTTGAFTLNGSNLTQAVVTYNTIADQGPSNSGGSNQNLGSLSSNVYIAVQFEAGSTYTMGKVGLNLRNPGTPANLTGNVNVTIAPDDIRSTDSGAVVPTCAGGATVCTVTNATTIANGDVGQRVTGTNIPNPSYIGAIDTTAHTFTIVTTKGGSTYQTIGTGTTGVSIWGKVGTAIATSSSIAASTIPTSYSTTYTNFSGFSCTITSGNTYWIVPHTDTVSGTTDFMQLRIASGNAGFITKNSATYPPTTVSSQSVKANFITYKP